MTFLGANLLKVFEGGSVPLALGGHRHGVDVHMAARQPAVVREIAPADTPLALVATLEKRPPQRVPGTAVFLTSDPDCAPTALMHSLKHYKVLHEKNVILTIEPAPTPRVDPAERVRIEPLGETFSRVTLRFGFMEMPNVPKALAIARKLGWQFDIMSTSFFLSAARSSRPRIPACRAGRTGCSSRSRAAPTTPPTISRSRPGGWSKWEPRSRSRL